VKRAVPMWRRQLAAMGACKSALKWSAKFKTWRACWARASWSRRSWVLWLVAPIQLAAFESHCPVESGERLECNCEARGPLMFPRAPKLPPLKRRAAK